MANISKKECVVMNDFKQIIKAGIFGVVVGDALGVPVEFTSREKRRADPVTDMRE